MTLEVEAFVGPMAIGVSWRGLGREASGTAHTVCERKLVSTRIL